MNSTIDQLTRDLWDKCVMRRAPKDQETINRWQTDEIAYLKEGYAIGSVPVEYRPIIHHAVSEWEKAEKELLESLAIGKKEYLQDFEKARASFLNGNNEWQQFISSTSNHVQCIVKNMEWVKLFSWVLPKADHENAFTYLEIGKMMASIFYIELISKFRKKASRDANHPLEKIEAIWSIVSQENAIEKRILFSLNNVLNYFQRNPYLFLYERDIQCALFSELRRNVTERFKATNTKGNAYELSAIYSEYGQPDLSGGKVDIVCLDEQKIAPFIRVPNKGFNTYIYNLPVLVGIEVKYFKMGDVFDIRTSWHDYEKMKQSKTIMNGMALFFIQDHENSKQIKSSFNFFEVEKITELEGVYAVSAEALWKVS